MPAAGCSRGRTPPARPRWTATASVWLFADDADRAYWGGMWSDRILESALATQLITSGLAEPAELADISAAFREWSRDPDGWFLVPHGEIVIRV